MYQPIKMNLGCRFCSFYLSAELTTKSDKEGIFLRLQDRNHYSIILS